MKIIKNLDLLIKTKLFAFLILSTNYNYANTTPKTTSSSKVEVTNVNTHVEKTKQDTKENNVKTDSNNNLHKIMATTGDCSASCCAGNNTTQKVDGSKKKTNSQKSKKRFGWFSR